MAFEGQRACGTVRLLLDCTNRCVFCAQKGITDTQPSPSEQLEAARRDSNRVVFTGGEPTLHPDLLEHVQAARALGFERIGLQTNGHRLGDRPFLDALALAGLSDIHLSIHGAEAATHEYHTGVPGSFATVLAACSAGRDRGMTTLITTVLTRSNFRSLGSLPKLLASRRVAAWLISLPRVGGRAREAFPRVVPRLGLAVPYALRALTVAETLGLSPWIAGAPHCVLGPYSRWALPEAPLAYADACEGCVARDVCPGVDPEYFARFGGDELSAARVHPGARERDVAELAAMFIGVGEVAPPPAPDAAAAPGKVSLPLLGKVKPARGEVSAGRPKRSGAALREILPGLFEGSDD
jgi:hypothetical protein